MPDSSYCLECGQWEGKHLPACKYGVRSVDSIHEIHFCQHCGGDVYFMCHDEDCPYEYFGGSEEKYMEALKDYIYDDSNICLKLRNLGRDLAIDFNIPDEEIDFIIDKLTKLIFNHRKDK